MAFDMQLIGNCALRLKRLVFAEAWARTISTFGAQSMVTMGQLGVF